MVDRAWREGRRDCGGRESELEFELEPEVEVVDVAGENATQSEGGVGRVLEVGTQPAGALVGVLGDVTLSAGLLAGELLLVAAAGVVAGAAGAAAGAKKAWDGPRRRRI
jgi:hypothetical protein